MILDRRHFLMTAAGALAARPMIAAPTSPVAIARCRTYGAGLTPTMMRMFDGIGGLGKLVNGKTVANNSSQTPCNMADTRVLPPASTLAVERTITPVIGNTPKKPQIIFPIPCEASSLSYLVRTP